MKLVFIITLSIVALVITWDCLTKKYLNPYKLVVIFGKKGCGKSTLLQKLAVYYTKKGYTCYCNIGDSELKECKQIPINDLPKLAEAGHLLVTKNDKTLAEQLFNEYKDKYKDVPNLACYIKEPSVILCDEINLLWDNRNFKNFSSDLQKYFRLQRHYRHIFIGFSQTFDCDKKIRDLADELLICKRLLRVFIVTKAYCKKVVVISPENANSREVATMTDDFVPLGFFHDTFGQFRAFLPYWVKYHNSFK